MAKKSESFQYGVDNLYTVPDSNTLKRYNYINGIIDQYQTARKKIIHEKQDWDELQVAKERYGNKPGFVSAHPPFKDPTSMLVAVRENGYAAYIDKVPEYNPFTEIAVVSVDSVTEYMNVYYGVNDQGFFVFRGALTCIIDKTDGLQIKFPTLVNPLLFSESYVYDDVAKEIVFSSPYYGDITVKAYTKAEFIDLDGIYFYVTNSGYDTIPTGKYPGYPLYKRITLDGVVNSFDTMIVNGLTIAVAGNLNKVLTTPYDESIDGILKIWIQSVQNNQQFLHIAFTPRWNEDIKPFYELPVTFKKGTESYSETVKLYTSVNQFNPLTELIKVNSPDIYFDVPTIYEFTFPATSYVDQAKVRLLKEIKGYYTDKEFTAPMEYVSTTNGMMKFVTDPVIIPAQDEIPTDIRFDLSLDAKDVAGMFPPLSLHGYSTSAIYRPPLNFLRVDQKFTSALTYTEGSKKTFRATFKGNGTLTIKSIAIKRVSDSLGYFSAADFTMVKVSEVKGLFTYDLGLDTKVFINPVTDTLTNMKFVFVFQCENEEGEPVEWNGEVLPADMTITYFRDRWDLQSVTLDVITLGVGKFHFKLYDKLLKAYTDKYSSNEALTLSNGRMAYSNNVTQQNQGMEWDFVTKLWGHAVRVNNYGDITIQYVDTVAVSNVVTLKHDKPTHPLVIKPRAATLYENITGRVYFDLTYTDVIQRIYVNGIRLEIDKTFAMPEGYDGNCVIAPIYAANGSTIIGIGVDITPKKGTKSITFSYDVTEVNDYDYSKWPSPITATVPVKLQSEGPKFTLRLVNFGFGKDCDAVLSLVLPELEDAHVVAVIFDPSTGKEVSKPNFDPVGNSDFKSDNFNIGNEFATKTNFILKMDIYEYENALKDNLLPNRLFHHVELPFEAK